MESDDTGSEDEHSMVEPEDIGERDQSVLFDLRQNLSFCLYLTKSIQSIV